MSSKAMLHIANITYKGLEKLAEPQELGMGESWPEKK